MTHTHFFGVQQLRIVSIDVICVCTTAPDEPLVVTNCNLLAFKSFSHQLVKKVNL